MCYWCHDRQKYEWNRIKSIKIDSHYGQLILNKDERQFNGESLAFSTNDVRINGYPEAKKKKKKELQSIACHIYKINHRPTYKT